MNLFPANLTPPTTLATSMSRPTTLATPATSFRSNSHQDRLIPSSRFVFPTENTTKSSSPRQKNASPSGIIPAWKNPEISSDKMQIPSDTMNQSLGSLLDAFSAGIKNGGKSGSPATLGAGNECRTKVTDVGSLADPSVNVTIGNANPSGQVPPDLSNNRIFGNSKYGSSGDFCASKFGVSNDFNPLAAILRENSQRGTPGGIGPGQMGVPPFHNFYNDGTTSSSVENDFFSNFPINNASQNNPGSHGNGAMPFPSSLPTSHSNTATSSVAPHSGDMVNFSNNSFGNIRNFPPFVNPMATIQNNMPTRGAMSTHLEGPKERFANLMDSNFSNSLLSSKGLNSNNNFQHQQNFPLFPSPFLRPDNQSFLSNPARTDHQSPSITIDSE